MCRISGNLYRFTFRENVDASTELKSRYDTDLIGQIALAVYNHHKENKVVYKLDAHAEEVFEKIAEKYNGQFNLKYASKCKKKKGLLVLFTVENSENDANIFL